MPDHLFTIVARGHAVDAQSNTLTLFSVLEDISTPVVPVAVLELTVATLWKRRENEEGFSFVQRTRLLDPTGTEVFHADTSFRMDKPRHRVLVTVGMAPFGTSGCYHIEVGIRAEDEPNNWSPAASYPIEVTLVPVPSEPSLLQGRES